MVSVNAQDEVKSAYWQIVDTTDLDAEPGPEQVVLVQTRIADFSERFQRSYPAAVKCLLADRDQLTEHLWFPVEHHRRIRHSNFIEGTFGETRRRVKVIGRPPGEASCLSLVWAVLDCASRGWRGFTITATGLRLLQDLRRPCSNPRPHSDPTPPAATALTVGAVA